jgi:hypothetical protein
MRDNFSNLWNVGIVVAHPASYMVACITLRFNEDARSRNSICSTDRGV